MYITIRRYKGVDIEKVREQIKSRGANEGVAPIVSHVPGFESYYLIDTFDGGLAAVSVFLDEAEANEATEGALQWVRTHMADSVPSEPEIIAGEVMVEAHK